MQEMEMCVLAALRSPRGSALVIWPPPARVTSVRKPVRFCQSEQRESQDPNAHKVTS